MREEDEQVTLLLLAKAWVTSDHVVVETKGGVVR